MRLMLLLSIALLASCSALDRPPKIEYGQACDTANKGKKFTVDGFLQITQRVPCMKMLSAARECSFKFADKVNIVGKEIIVHIPVGKGKGAVETPEAGKSAPPSSVFGPGDIKIRLSDGTEIAPQLDVATPVTVSGEIHITGDATPICSITAESITKR